MEKAKLGMYNVKLLVVITNSQGVSFCDTLVFDTFSENDLNAVLDVMKVINLDLVKLQRASNVDFNSDLTWYDATEYLVIKVVSVDNCTK